MSGVTADFGRTVRNIVSRTGIIFVYLIFLLFDSALFDRRLKRCSQTSCSSAKSLRLLITFVRTRSHLGIKVLTSAVTGLISYIILRFVGLEFASFWAV